MDIKKMAIAGALLFAAYKYGGQYGKAASLALAAVIVGKQVPYIKDVM